MPAAKSKNPTLPSYDIKINGSPLKVEGESHVVGIAVEDDVGLPSMFTFELATSAHQDDEHVWVDDENLFKLGNVVEVKLGSAGELKTLIIGEVTGLEPEFARNRLPSLIVRGYDRRHRLHRGRKTKTFVQKKDSDIASQIASEAGLTAQAEDSGVTHDYVVQANQTDMEFLQERARRIQYEVIVDDKTLFFRPVANDESEVLTLTLEDDLLEFYPRLSSARQVSGVAVRGWNPKDKKEFLGEAKTGDEVSTMGGQNSGGALIEAAFGAAATMVSDRPVMTQAEADQMAKARFNNAVLGLIYGEGVCRGRTDLRAGKVIKIDAIGRRFSGQYYVTAASHRYSPQQGYYTHFTVRRNAS
jgi:phage protein D